MTRYVLGFLFSKDKKRVVMIKKRKPEWQKGLLNGVGGKIEKGEGSLPAMIREFKEETGLYIENWLNVGNIDDIVDIFYSVYGGIDKVCTMEAERVSVEDVTELKLSKLVKNTGNIIVYILKLEADKNKIKDM